MRNLLVSVSGGKTSMRMASLLKESPIADNQVYIFANTGQESEGTYEFLKLCDQKYGFNIIWLESVINDEGVGTTWKVVDFYTAHRGDGLFEPMIQKYGIPNKSYPHCTRELKLAPIHKYVKRALGWDDYDTAIGIRNDEHRRVSRGGEYNIVYPLIDNWPMDKADVNYWWDQQGFNLEIPEYNGNCLTCFKKSTKKLAMVHRDNPKSFDFNRRMEKYKHIGDHHDRVFFRGNKNTEQLVEEFKLYKSFLDQGSLFSQEGDEDDGCSESCEMYPMVLR